MIEKSYELAREQYAVFGVETETALERLGQVSLSVHCWQGDDVAGFERPEAALSGGGIMVTGSYPGRARTIGELRQDLEQAYSSIAQPAPPEPARGYGDFGGRFVDRDAIEPDHFQGWADWAKAHEAKLDFNPTCYSHPKGASGFTLSDKDPAVRAFWVEHVRRCRMIGAHLGRQLSSPCIHNLWIPDGAKEMPVDRRGYRALLGESLDAIYATEYSPTEMKDAVEGKLFGIGSESFVVGSHDFYLGFALKRMMMPCLDLGHYHPTESVADKLSSLLPYFPEVLIHVSRGVRWDSDHVPILDDATRRWADAIVGCQALGRVHLALGLLRRQHQPGRRLGDRRPRDPQGAAARAALPTQTGRGGGGTRRRFHSPRAAGGGEDAAGRRGVGQVLPAPRHAGRRRLDRRRAALRCRGDPEADVKRGVRKSQVASRRSKRPGTGEATSGRHPERNEVKRRACPDSERSEEEGILRGRACVVSHWAPASILQDPSLRSG